MKCWLRCCSWLQGPGEGASVPVHRLWGKGGWTCRYAILTVVHEHMVLWCSLGDACFPNDMTDMMGISELSFVATSHNHHCKFLSFRPITLICCRFHVTHVFLWPNHLQLWKCMYSVCWYTLLGAAGEVLKQLSWVDKLLPVWIIGAMVLGVLLGYYVPSVSCEAFSCLWMGCYDFAEMCPGALK